jgi:parvulin-like peptidyl-prolyl isomerase
LRDYWGWSLADFKRSLKEEILAEKVVAKLDKANMARANDALLQAKAGTDFGTLAAKLSDDPSAKTNAGDYGAPITRTNPNIPPQVVTTLFKLKPGQVSGVINTG